MGYLDQAEYHFFPFFPYTDLSADQATRASLWVDYPNSYYDPKIGHDLFTDPAEFCS